MIPTGGSSGRVRFAIHTWDTLTASVEACRQYFQVDRLHSCCILPLYHVSGLMQFLRSLLSGGKLAVLSAKTLNAKPCPIDPSEFFLSLVPTQLQRWLQMPAQATWLSRFHTVLLGGGPAWSDLLQTARHHQIRLAPTYGMTETASQIVTLKPDDFLQGKPGCGQALPHAQIQIRNEAGQVLAPRQVGAIAIQATSLALGYYPELFAQSEFQTDDLGFLDDQGYLHVVGRRSQKIITGGENVFPAEVEAVIRASQLVDDVCVLGIPDAEWGEAVTAVYVPSHSQASQDKLRAIVEQQLSRYKRPKRWIPVQTLPRNAQGKVNYAEVKRWLQDRVQG
jgi:O-succinylbenzoic acid--CoA ligase